MGNINCCDDSNKKDKDFNVQSIFEEVNYKNEKNKSTENLNLNLNDGNESSRNKLTNESTSFSKNRCYDSDSPVQIKLEDFNYSTNSNKNCVKNYKKENINLNMMKLVKHTTFEKICPQFASKFIDELNKARTDLFGFSEKLSDYSQNFEVIQKKIDEIINEKLRKRFSRTEEEFKKASDFFKKLYQEKKENFEELIEIDQFKLPISESTKEMKEDKYYKKFQRRFESKFSQKFIFRKVLVKLVHEDPETSFLLFITKNTEELEFIFQKEMKYIGIDFKVQSNMSVLLTLNLVRDK